MKRVLLGLAVATGLLLALSAAVTTPHPAAAERDCVDGPPEWCATAEAGEYAHYNYYATKEAEYAEEQSSVEDYYREQWVATYLAPELAAATYWRGGAGPDPSTGKRIGTLNGVNTAEEVRYPCDPNYDDALSGGCVPADRDYDCVELRSWGIVNIPIMNNTFMNVGDRVVHQVFRGEDWMLLDDNHDGIGCEVEPQPEEVIAIQAAYAVVPTFVPTVVPTNQCDGLVGTVGCFLFGP